MCFDGTTTRAFDVVGHIFYSVWRAASYTPHRAHAGHQTPSTSMSIVLASIRCIGGVLTWVDCCVWMALILADDGAKISHFCCVDARRSAQMAPQRPRPLAFAGHVCCGGGRSLGVLVMEGVKELIGNSWRR